MRRTNVILLTAALLFPPSSYAQHDSGLVGKRVWVRAPALNVSDNNATLIGWSRDSVTLTFDVPIEIPRVDDRALYLSTLSSPTLARVWAPDFYLEGAKVELYMDESGIMQVRSKHFALEMPPSAITRIQPFVEEGHAVTMSLGSVESIAVYRGRKSHAGAGAALGASVGAIGVGMAAAALCSSLGCNIGVAILPIGGALLGAGLGAVGGLAASTDRWEEIPTYRFRLAPVITGTRFGLAGSVRF